MYFGYFEVVHSERGLLLYLILSTFFMEIILRWQSGLAFFGQGLFFMAMFGLAFILFSMTIFHGFPRRISRRLVRVWFLIVTLAFAAQFVYFSIFRTYFTFYSMINSYQAFSFYKIVLIYMLRDPRWILLLLPFILFLFINRRLAWQPQGGLIDYGLLFILCIIIIITLLGMGGGSEDSPRDLLAYSAEPIIAVHQLGIIGNGYGELRRQVFSEKDPYYPPEGAIIPRQGSNVSYDLGAFLEETDDFKLAEITSYLLSRKPTDKNVFTGRLSGYNLIYIVAESFSDLAVDKNLTPTLYNLIEDSVDFENFYNPLWGVSTTDGEYAALTGLIPASGVWSMVESANNYLPQSLASQFNKLGYKSYAFHNHDYKYYSRNITHANLGYDFYALGNGLDLEKTWPESDLEMVEKTLDFYLDQEPFHTYYLTVSGHIPYDFINNEMSKKHVDQVEKLNLSKEAKAYLASHIELDKAMELLIENLKLRGILDRTLIVLHGDHFPYGLRDSALEELAGRELDKFEEYKSKIIFYTPTLEGVKVSKPTSSLDMLPTISNLFGLDFDSRLMMGRDVFSQSQPLVEFVSKSFITPEGYYDSINKQVEGLEAKELEDLKVLVAKKFYYSKQILETDYYDKIKNYKIIYEEPPVEEEEDTED